MKNVFIGMSLVCVLAACSSPVKLDTPTVIDSSPQPVVPSDSKGTETGDSKVGTVTTVDLTSQKMDAAVPTAGRIVYFDYDSFVIRPEFQAAIETHAKFLKAEKTRKVVVEGHTDERGGREYNLALGQKRAEAVRRSLALLGVSDLQVEAVSFGKEKPAVLGSSEAAMEKNRRADISYR